METGEDSVQIMMYSKDYGSLTGQYKVLVSLMRPRQGQFFVQNDKFDVPFYV